jgi:hypothetical protein
MFGSGARRFPHGSKEVNISSVTNTTGRGQSSERARVVIYKFIPASG